MIDYFRRLIKILLYIVFFFVLLLGIIPAALYGRSIASSMHDLLANNRFLPLVLVLLAYTLVYPLISFVKFKRHLNGSFTENRPYFEEAFQMLGYEKVGENGFRIIYRKKSKLARATSFWEDKVTLDTEDNPVIISGTRKSVYRLNRNIEQAIFKGQPL